MYLFIAPRWLSGFRRWAASGGAPSFCCVAPLSEPVRIFLCSARFLLMAASSLRSLRLRGSHFWCFSGFAGFALFRFCFHSLDGGFVLIALGFGVLRARSLLRLVVRSPLWTNRVALSTTAGLRSLPFYFLFVFVCSHCGFYRVVIGSSLFLHFDQNASDCKRAHVV